MEVRKIYSNRFSEEDIAAKRLLWKTLCEEFFQRYVREDAVLVDIGAGYCEFVNSIKAREKYAIDLNEDVKRFAEKGVRVFNREAASLDFLKGSSVDVVFMSNFLEHMKDKDSVMAVLKEAHRVLKPGGVILILQPNIRFLYNEYWDFFDHNVPISDRSLAEALEIAGFRIKELIPRFLPYTTKSRLPQGRFFVRAYLRLPFIWPFFGKQVFACGAK